MNSRMRVGIGVLLMVLGAIWTLQGLDVLGGSSMSGVTLWAVIGPVVAVLGLTLALSARRRDSA